MYQALGTERKRIRGLVNKLERRGRMPYVWDALKDFDAWAKAAAAAPDLAARRDVDRRHERLEWLARRNAYTEIGHAASFLMTTKHPWSIADDVTTRQRQRFVGGGDVKWPRGVPSVMAERMLPLLGVVVDNLDGRSIEDVAVIARLLRSSRPKRETIRSKAATLLFLIEDQEWVCAYCDVNLRIAPVEIDHIVPVACGGGSEISNLVASCAGCNRRKHVETWIPCRGRLAEVRA
jgi:hypothetical protein